MKSVTASTFVLVGVLLSTPAHAQLSAVCKYHWATETYALMTYCADPAAATVKGRYLILRTILNRHMKAGGIDTKAKFGAAFDRSVRQTTREKPAAERCRDPFYSSAKRVFFHLISSAGVKEAVSDMKAGKDPNEGDCL
jgi:hypothetical protein